MSTWGKMADAKKVEEKPAEIKRPEFKRVIPTETSAKLKLALHGQEKVGKTRFIMSAKAPIYIIASEPGVLPLARLFPDKEIYVMDVYTPDPSEMFAVEATKTLENIENAVKILREKAWSDPGSVGTVGVDSVTDVWKWIQSWMKTEILKIDKTARVKQQWDWQYANDKYQNIVMQLLSLPCNVILTGQDKQEYVKDADGKWVPADYIPRWQGQTGYWVDIIMAFSKIKDKQGKTRYMAEIEDSRHMDEDLEPLAGIQMENPTFDKLVEILKRKKEPEKKELEKKESEVK